MGKAGFRNHTLPDRPRNRETNKRFISKTSPMKHAHTRGKNVYHLLFFSAFPTTSRLHRSTQMCIYILYLYIYIKKSEEGPPFEGEEDCAHLPVRLAPILIVLNTVATSMRSFFLVLQIWNAHALGESQVVRQHWSSLVVSSRAFVLHFSHVFGEPAARL